MGSTILKRKDTKKLKKLCFFFRMLAYIFYSTIRFGKLGGKKKMGLVGTANAFLLLFLPIVVLSTAHNIHFGRNLLVVVLGVLVQILQLFVVASFSLRNVPFSEIAARCAAAAIIPSVFAFLLRDAKARKAFALASTPDRERVLATTAAAAALVVHHLGPFYYSIGSAGFDEGPLISGARFNLRLICYLCTASALSGGCPLWLSILAASVSGLCDDWRCDAATALVTSIVALLFRGRASPHQE